MSNSIRLVPNRASLHKLYREKFVEADLETPSGVSHTQVFRAKTSEYLIFDWVEQLLVSNLSMPLQLASESQLMGLWQQVLSNQQKKFPRIEPLSLCREALRAWRLCKLWRISTAQLEAAETGQLLRFSSWLIEFEQRLREAELVTLETLAEKVLEGNSLNLNPNLSLHLCGFAQEMEPLWQTLLESTFSIKYRGLDTYFSESVPSNISLSQYKSLSSEKPIQNNLIANHPINNQSISVCSADDFDQELRAATTWLNQCLERDPTQRIALIDTRFLSRSKIVRRIIRENLDPSFSVRYSLQPPLTETGFVSCALALLQLNKSKIDLGKAREIIRHPCWGHFNTEHNLRAHWETNLCELQVSSISTSAFAVLVQEIPDTESGAVAERLTNFIRLRKRNTKLKPSEWAGLFDQQLSALQLEFKSLNSKENTDSFLNETLNETKDSWYQVLNNLCQLDAVMDAMPFEGAYGLLVRESQASRPNSQSAKSGVHIVDTVEAAVDFDAAWMLSTDQSNWPSSPQPNTLLPQSLQRNFGLPGATPEAQISLAEDLILLLLKSTPGVVFSFAKSEADKEYWFSPIAKNLLAGQEVVHIEASYLIPDEPSLQLSSPDSFEWINCASAPPLLDTNRLIHSGASLLQTQASSPFDAFAHWRLDTSPLLRPEIGLHPGDRGTLIHRAFQLFWELIPNDLSASSLSDSQINETADLSAYKTLIGRPDLAIKIGDLLAEEEIARISQRVRSMAKFDRDRSLSFSIAASENKLNIEIGGLIFNLRLDRLDEVVDQEGHTRYLLIDYKTSATLSSKQWLDDLPSQPQLPLYCLALDSPPDAITYAQSLASGYRLIGIGNFDIEEGVKLIPDWDQLLKDWRLSLTECAESFVRGDCRVMVADPDFSREDELAPLHRSLEYDAIIQYQDCWMGKIQ